MPNYYHPGVYIAEIPSSRTIQAASTSVAAFVGVCEAGPVQTPTLVTSWNAYLRLFGGLAWFSYMSWAVYEFFNEGGTTCYIVRLKDTAKAAQASATLANVKLATAIPGTWGNSLQVLISGPSTTTNGTAQSTPVFNVGIAVDASILEAATLDVPTQLLADYVSQNNLAPVPQNGKLYYVLESFNGFTPNALSCPADGTTCALSTRINGSSMFVRATASPSGNNPGRPQNGLTPLTGGSAATYDYTVALQTLTKVQGISLLSMPDTVAGADASGKISQAQQGALINAGLNFCEQQANNLFYVTDPPYGLNVQDIRNFKLGAGSKASGNQGALNSSYGALYYPWVWILNPIGNVNVPIPPSGAVLGRYANTDVTAGVFKSPAGVNDGALRTVIAPGATVTDSDQDSLNPIGINAIRNIIGYGNLIWGARTVSLDTSWTYVSVRRFFIFVEQSLMQSLQWVVFEPNGEALWSAVTRDISAFLTAQWHQNALFGSKASEAFFVTCDASNNPPETRANGLLYIDVGLAPVYPAEFVVIRLTQKTAGPDSGS